MNSSAIAIRALFAVTFISSTAFVFDLDYFNQERIDVYLFFKHEQYLIFVIEDVIEKISLSALTYAILKQTHQKEAKSYVRCFFWVSVAATPYYFLFYSQYSTQVLLPTLIFSLIYTRWKNDKKGHINR